MRATAIAPTAESTRRRDLHAIVADGVFFSAMVGLGESYVPAFALAAGHGEIVAGLVATLPMLAGALFQLVTPWAVRHLRSYRRWVVVCACLQAASFVPLCVGAALGRISLGWLALSTVAYWSFGMATSPAWNAWVTSLVPLEERPLFFASRTRMAHIALFAALLVGGVALQWGREHAAQLGIFAALFATAACMRFISARYLSQQSEAPGLAAAHRALGPGPVLASIRRARSGRVLMYLVGMQAVVNVAAPFFTPYMLGPLALSYTEYMALTAAAFLARVAVLPWIGRIAHQRGTRLVLWLGAVGIVPLPMLWMVSDHFVYLLVVQLIAGSAWAALEFATLMSFFEGIEEHERASVLSAFNLVNAIAIALGALAGSQIFAALQSTPGAYDALFVVSSLGRLLMLGLLLGTPEVQHLLRIRFRSLAVRPSAGAIERPILASLDEEPASGERSGSLPPARCRR